MNTLIAYATRYGLTERCAKSLAGKLKGKIELVNLQYKKVDNIREYDRVIIGGSIYLGKIQKSITQFCEDNYSELLNKRVGLFICCSNQEKVDRYFEKAFPKELLRNAWGKVHFGGQINIDENTLFDKIFLKLNNKIRNSHILVDNIKVLADILEGDESPVIEEESFIDIESESEEIDEILGESEIEIDELIEYELENIE